MNQPGAKICIRCGEDCSDRPRLKDASGRYMCKACAAREARVPAAPIDPSDLGPIMLDDAGAIPLAGDAPSECPKCKAKMSEGAVLCVACGHGAERFIPATPAEPERLSRPSRMRFAVPAKCPRCSYDLKGVKSERCPECGELITPAAMRRLYSERARREVYVKSYVIPAALLFVGLAVWVPVYAMEHGAGDVVAEIIGRIVAVALGLLAYFICGILWLGFDAPWHLTALRLLGIQNFGMGLVAGLDLMGVPGLLSLVAWVLVTYVLLMSLMDMESQDAIGFLAVVMIIYMALFFVLLSSGLLG
ncbi:MAG: hypothetical protein ACK5WB_04645 [Phycisphaerales bacterium]|jgi:rubrerythrin|nr:hypothetical protein [Phycisphaeraceae bacterium]